MVEDGRRDPALHLVAHILVHRPGDLERFGDVATVKIGIVDFVGKGRLAVVTVDRLLGDKIDLVVAEEIDLIDPLARRRNPDRGLRQVAGVPDRNDRPLLALDRDQAGNVLAIGRNRQVFQGRILRQSVDGQGLRRPYIGGGRNRSGHAGNQPDQNGADQRCLQARLQRICAAHCPPPNQDFRVVTKIR